jgi:hypothetical protein
MREREQNRGLGGKEGRKVKEEEEYSGAKGGREGKIGK